jgi:membrane-bound lytic murein transglycosylase A
MNTRKFANLALSTVWIAMLLSCSSSRKAIEIPGEVPVSKAVTMNATTPKKIVSENAASNADASIAGESLTFATQSANYTAMSFEQMPGWSTDNFQESWPAFLESCKVMASRGVQWRDLCARAKQVDRNNAASIRGFYEREFAAYQMQDDDRKIDGVVTGYFEPEVKGSRRYGAPYIYPVYGLPDDMLYLDARKITAAQRAGTVAVRLEGRNVVVQNNLSTKDMSASDVYALNLSGLSFDTIDRKVRLRVNGKQLQPYYTREEIETLGAPNAKVLAFVDSATALYEMHVQGSGRIRMREGDEVMRVSYAEQNGHPFRPTLVQASNGKTATKLRGSSLELLDGDDEGDEGAIRTRGFKLAKPVSSGAVVVPGQKALAKPPAGSGIKDPSYVFFREAAEKTGGPVGALGVPLSAGRSIAVDPRSTPLGYPVFVSTRNPTSGAPMRRLTVAQDTGGAIRGAVRADYFFGDGPQAAQQARRMKERGQLWLLLPRGLKVAATSVTGRTRGGSTVADLAECLVPSENECVNPQ